ncbi:hypothetical protein AB3M89_11965 [Microbacterium sp. 179-I 3D2 NHS]|uniref:hypothetical protein n=1 Tax=Microbacterium sp. 179-I 3D2 NHS TaxID=3235178 RepID=UPI0039A223EF
MPPLRFLIIGGLLGIEPVPVGGYGVGQELSGIPDIAFVWSFAQQAGLFLALLGTGSRCG